MAGEVRGFDAGSLLDRKEIRRTDRYAQFGLVATAEALAQAGLPDRFEGELAERTGVILGTGLGGVGTLIEGFTTNALRGPDRISPFLVPMGIPNVGAGQVAIQFGMIGPNFTTVSACATGGHAIGEASEIIRRGDADVMVAGGAEAAIYEAMVGGFAAMRALSMRNDDPGSASRPFDSGRDGFVIGEGAGVMILESLEHAEGRGVEILAELTGYGATADASHITLPAPGGIGAVRAARRALEKAGLTPADIDHVNAHATSTPEGDKAELQAIRTIFGDDAARVAITANKSMVGHTLGAAGAIEAITTVLSIRERLHPADDQPGRSGSGGGRARPDARHGGDPRDPGRAEQLVRLWRAEHRPGVQSVGGVTDAATPAEGQEPAGGPETELLVLIDRLADLLHRSDLTELEVESGGTGLVLRKALAAAAPASPIATGAAPISAGTDSAGPAVPAVPSIKAPLTGIFYASPAPGTAPYVQAGGEVAVGQVIGLIEAMKLFNEIKSDLAGRVLRVVPESGALVKAKQPLIEVEPL